MLNISLSKRFSGFTLLEVLVAMVILALGLLGLAGLHVKSLQFSQSAQGRSVATVLANDMMDRMRANKTAVGDGTTADATDDFYDLFANSAADAKYTTQKSACLTAAGCTPVEMAQNDAYEWQQAVARALPKGVAIVCRDRSSNNGSFDGTTITHGCDNTPPVSTYPNTYAIKIFWLDDRSKSSVTYNSFVTRFVP